MLDRRSFVLGAATGVGAMTVMSSKIVEAAAEQTVSLNVIYPNHDGARFDMRYYRDTHIPLAMKVMKADPAAQEKETDTIKEKYAEYFGLWCRQI